MERNSIVMRLAALVLLLQLPACGGGDAYGPLTAPSGKVTEEQAATVLSEFDKAAATFKVDGAVIPPAINGVTYGLVAQDQQDIYAPCRKDTPSPIVDEDQDQIPLYKKMVFDCDVDDGVAKRVQKGEVSAEDFDDTKKWGVGGYQYVYDLEGESVYKAGGQYSYLYKGFFRYEADDDSYQHTSNYTYFTAGDSPSDGKYAMQYQSTWLHLVKPDDMADPGKSGKIEYSGFFHSSGKSEDPTYIEHNVTVAMTSTNVLYDRSCAHFYKEGTVHLADASGNVIGYEYKCTEVIKTYNGKPLK